MMNSTPEKLLIVGPAWVGDMVMAQTLFTLLKARNPQAEIHVLAPDWTRPLLDRMPEVSKAISLPIGHGVLAIKTRYQIGRQLRQENYAHAYVLPNSFKSALIPWFAKISKRTGWRGEMRYGLLNDLRILDKEKYRLMIERFMALGLEPDELLVKPYPKPHLLAKAENIKTALATLQLSKPAKPVLAVCPGAEFGPSKRWPAEYFGEVANHYLAKDWEIWLFGSVKDQEITNSVNQATGNRCIDLAGKTNLAQAIDLMSITDLVISNDSGLMHIACALQKPVVAMYGSTSQAFTPPLGNEVKILSIGISCSPCFKRECPLGHWKCMRDLKPQMAINALQTLETQADIPVLS